MLLLRHEEFTRKRVFEGKKNSPFKDLISNSEGFKFNMDDIARLRDEIRTLIENLSDIYGEWKKLQDDGNANASPGMAEVLTQPKKQAGQQGHENLASSKLSCRLDAKEREGQEQPRLNKSLSERNIEYVEQNERGGAELDKTNSATRKDGNKDVPLELDSTGTTSSVVVDEKTCGGTKLARGEATALGVENIEQDGVSSGEVSSSATVRRSGEEKENTVNEVHDRPTIDTANGDPVEESKSMKGVSASQISPTLSSPKIAQLEEF